MSLRRALALAVLVVMVAAPCLGVCTGWSASGHERMACCVDKSQGETDACCASDESRQSDSTPVTILQALPALEPVTLKWASVVFSAPAAFDLESHNPLTSGSERHVLLSVFLI